MNINGGLSHRRPKAQESEALAPHQMLAALSYWVGSLILPRHKPERRNPMDEHDCLVEQFEAERPNLRAVAYRLLGSLPSD